MDDMEEIIFRSIQEKMIADCYKAIELNPNDSEAYNKLGVAMFNLGNYKEAIADYNKAIGLNQNLAEAYYNLGVAKYRIADYNDAIVNWMKAVELNSPKKDDIQLLIDEARAKMR